MRSYNTDVQYLETCPAKDVSLPSYMRKHRWRKVEGSDKKHPTKPGYRVRQNQCEHCKEVTHCEYTFISLG